MFVVHVLFLSLFCCLIRVSKAVASNQCNELFVAEINSRQSTWIAAGGDVSRPHPMALGAKLDSEGLASIRLNRSGLATPLSLPHSFDARIHWPLCESIAYDIRDQGGCGSCWAMASAAAMTDRQCIRSRGWDRHRYSAADLIAMSRSGCQGHSVVDAFALWLTQGVVSSECKPYQDWNRGGHWIESRDSLPACELLYNTNYQADKRYSKKIYSLLGESEIQEDLYVNGPVVAGFREFEDFGCYKHGVYHHTSGKFQGLHAVKIIGWGEENEEKYWIAANSWGRWGEQGFFRIRRGRDECGIESTVVAGIPY